MPKKNQTGRGRVRRAHGGLRKGGRHHQTASPRNQHLTARMMAYYEGANAHPPGHLLPEMARALGVSVEALLGTETAKRKTKAVDTRMQRRLQQLERLDPTERRQILQVIDAFIERNQLKQRAQAKEAA